MKLLMVCATAPEFPFPLPEGENNPGTAVQVLKNRFPGLEIYLLITGPGMVPATFHLLKALLQNSYDLVIQAGIAGCFHKSVPLGKVFFVQEDCFAWWGAEDNDNFISVFEMGLVGSDSYPFENQKLVDSSAFTGIIPDNLSVARAITVHCSHGKESTVSKAKALYSPDLESMEGAAAFYVCKMQKIPFIQLRSVSNLVEKRNKKAWDIPRAVYSLGIVIEQVLSNLSEANPTSK